MTLLESMVALVIVGLFAVGILDLLQGSSASSRDTGDWATAVAYADATMEGASFSSIRIEPDLPPPPAGFSAATRRMDHGDGLDEIIVTVTLPNGKHFLLRRLAIK